MTNHRLPDGADDKTPQPVMDFQIQMTQLIGAWQSKVSMALESSRLSEEEVRRLRHRCDMEVAHIAELKEQVRSSADQCRAQHQEIDALMAERDRLRSERDEARREICINEANDLAYDLERKGVFGIAGKSMADKRGWDCFKEEDGK